MKPRFKVVVNGKDISDTLQQYRLANETCLKLLSATLYNNIA